MSRIPLILCVFIHKIRLYICLHRLSLYYFLQITFGNIFRNPMVSKMFPVSSEGNRSAPIVLFAHLTCFPCGNPVFGWYTNVPMLLHGIPAIVLVGYETSTIVRSYLARPVPPTKQILFYPTKFGDHWIIIPICAFFAVYDTIRPSSLLSI